MPMYDFECEVCERPGREWRPEGHPPRFCGKEHMTEGMVGQKRTPTKYVITQEIRARIEKVYKTDTGNGQVAALAKALGFPRWKITRYAVEHNLTAKQNKEPDWTETETECLQKLARYSPGRIQIKMKEGGYTRYINGIVLKMKRMKMRQNIAGHSARDVARCLGVDDHFVTRAIKAGRLKATRRGTDRTERQGGDHWYILSSNVRQYILKHLYEIDIRKVDKHWFVDLIAN